MCKVSDESQSADDGPQPPWYHYCEGEKGAQQQWRTVLGSGRRSSANSASNQPRSMILWRFFYTAICSYMEAIDMKILFLTAQPQYNGDGAKRKWRVWRYNKEGRGNAMTAMVHAKQHSPKDEERQDRMR